MLLQNHPINFSVCKVVAKSLNWLCVCDLLSAVRQATSNKVQSINLISKMANTEWVGRWVVTEGDGLMKVAKRRDGVPKW